MAVPLTELLDKLQKGPKMAGQSVKINNVATGTSYDIVNTAANPSVGVDKDGNILIYYTT